MEFRYDLETPPMKGLWHDLNSPQRHLLSDIDSGEK